MTFTLMNPSENFWFCAALLSAKQSSPAVEISWNDVFKTMACMACGNWPSTNFTKAVGVAVHKVSKQMGHSAVRSWKRRFGELLNCWQQKHLVSSTRAVGCRHWSISCCICGEITCRNKNWWTTLRWWAKIRGRVRGQFMVKYSILAATPYKFPPSWPIRAKRGASKSLNPGTFFSAWSFSWKRKRWGSFSQKMDKHGLFSQDTWSQKNSTLHCQQNQRILWIFLQPVSSVFGTWPALEQKGTTAGRGTLLYH